MLSQIHSARKCLVHRRSLIDRLLQAEEALRNPVVVEIEPEMSGTERFVDTMKDLSHTVRDTMKNLAHNIPEPVSKVLEPITAALHPNRAAVAAPTPAGADTEVHVDEIDKVESVVPSHLVSVRVNMQLPELSSAEIQNYGGGGQRWSVNSKMYKR